MILPILEVADVDASIAFYTDKLGFQQTMSLPGPDDVTAFAFVQRGNATIGLSRKQHTATVGQGVTLMTYVGDDVDMAAFAEDVKHKGIPLLSELKKEYWGDLVFTVQDIDGYTVSLCQTVEEVSPDEIAAIMQGNSTGDTERHQASSVDVQ